MESRKSISMSLLSFGGGDEQDEIIFEEVIKKTRTKLERDQSIPSGKYYVQNDKLKSCYSSSKHKVKRILKNQKYQYLILSLAGLHCFCVLVELLIEFIDLSITKNEFIQTKQLLKNNLENLNGTHVSIRHLNEFESYMITRRQLHHGFHLLVFILQLVSTGILAAFTLEIIVKLIFVPKCFVETRLEAIDGIIVLISFVSNLILFKRETAIASVIGFFIIIK